MGENLGPADENWRHMASSLAWSFTVAEVLSGLSFLGQGGDVAQLAARERQALVDAQVDIRPKSPTLERRRQLSGFLAFVGWLAEDLAEQWPAEGIEISWAADAMARLSEHVFHEGGNLGD